MSLFLALNLLNVLDTILTTRALGLGVEESAWLPMRWVIDTFPNDWQAIKVLSVFTLSVALAFVSATEPGRRAGKIADAGLLGLVLFYAVAMTYNFWWFVKIGGLG